MSSFQDDEIKEQVRRATDIVQLIGSYINLRPDGRLQAGLCPFHDDSKPSLKINPARQTWKCWVCDIGGDVFQWVMHREGVGFGESLRILADDAGIELKRSRGYSAQAATDKATLYDAMKWASQQFHECLLSSDLGAPARKYLANRGIDEESIKRHRIGFAPDRSSWLLDRSRTTPFSEETLVSADVIRPSKIGGHYEWFRGRVIFPIHDTRGRAIALGGRILPELADEAKAKGKDLAKYFNSGDTRLFRKSEHLYGLDQALNSLKGGGRLVVMEGYTDVVMARQFGVEGVVAVLGTALNENHIKAMRRHNAGCAVLVLDGDKAGQRRANEVLRLFVAAQIDLRVVVLPEGADPCDFLLNQGTAAFDQLVDNSLDALDHKLALETDGVDLLRDTHRANEAMTEVLKLIAHAPQSATASQLREQQMYAKVARRFAVDEELVRNHVAELRTKQRRNTSTPVNDRRRSGEQSLAKQRSGKTDQSQGQPRSSAPAVNADEMTLLEREMFELLTQHPELDTLARTVKPAWLSSATAKTLFEVYRQIWVESKEASFQCVMDAADDDALKCLLAGIEMDAAAKHESSLEDPEERMNGVISRLRENHEQEAVNRQVAQLKESKNPEEDASQLASLIAKMSKKH